MYNSIISPKSDEFVIPQTTKQKSRKVQKI